MYAVFVDDGGIVVTAHALQCLDVGQPTSCLIEICDPPFTLTDLNLGVRAITESCG